MMHASGSAQGRQLAPENALPTAQRADGRATRMAPPRATRGFDWADRAVDSAVESAVMQRINRHEAELFGSGVGVATAGVLFWCDPPVLHARR